MRKIRLLGVGVAIATAVGVAAPMMPAAGAAPSSPTPQSQGLTYLGATDVRAASAAARANAAHTRPAPTLRDLAPDRERNMKPEGAKLAVTPGNPRPLPVLGKGPALAIDGLDHTDQRLAFNGNQFNHEPPDGAICAGATSEVEMVNAGLQFFGTDGSVQTAPIALNQFWGLPPELDRSTNREPGPGLGDIRCVFDAQTHRYLLLAWGIDVDPVSGADTGTQAYYIAAQATADPLGTYHLFKFSLEPPTQPGCRPICEADFPATSTDANTFVVTYDRFLGNGGFTGARILVFSKRALLAGHVSPVVKFTPGPLGGGLVGAIMGAQVPAGGNEVAANGGTHYLIATLDPQGTGDNRAGLFGLTHTSAIRSHPAQVALTKTVVPRVLTYALPPKITQKPGPRPLGAHLKQQVGAPNEPINKLDAGGDQPGPSKYAGGLVWTIIDTQVGSGRSARSGLLGLGVKPAWHGGKLTGTVAAQGYAAVATNSLSYGDLAITPNGSSAVGVASLAGPTIFPSAVYFTFSAAGPPKAVHLYLKGVRPEDGFSCYQAFVGPGPGGAGRGCRWGDYSMANLSPNGQFWFETEYITPRARFPLADWGTAIGRLPAS